MGPADGAESVTGPGPCRRRLTSGDYRWYSPAGLYRFIASDRLLTNDIPEDIVDIVLAYVDGETLNLINERVVPGEDIHGRIVDNALRIHRLLVLDTTAGKRSTQRAAPRQSYPKLQLISNRYGG